MVDGWNFSFVIIVCDLEKKICEVAFNVCLARNDVGLGYRARRKKGGREKEHQRYKDELQKLSCSFKEAETERDKREIDTAPTLARKFKASARSALASRTASPCCTTNMRTRI